MSITTPTLSPSSPAGLSEAVLALIDRPGPRYTSYPTADRFSTRVGAADYEVALGRRAQSGAKASPVGLYLHIPFCESVCYYCACNKVVTRQHGRAKAYLEALTQEMGLHAQVLGYRTPIASLHLGGGTPTFLSDEELTGLMRSIHQHFTFTPGAELAIEVDPRTVSTARLSHLGSLGFNRLSMGVQDFDPEVQKAVHRVQSHDQVAQLVQDARALGYDSINLDLIYGLPQQSATSFSRTLEQVTAIRPDRLALYAYAHLPQRFKPQRRIDESQLPSAAARLAMLGQAIDRLLQAGYVYIGMDHFALPGDELAVAKRQGRLHRNFQGYTAMPDVDLIGLGVSSIGRVGPQYVQNLKDIGAYQDALSQGRFPVERGVWLSRDDLLRRSVIMALMCQGRVEFESIELAHLVDFREHFGAELRALEAWQEQGMIRLEPRAIALTDLGWFGVRAVAMVFDRHLQQGTAQRFSRIA
jgi:oxygen-independent coproporphyrinogen-3 oxidase